jgi:MOSC domain-containing protein YiiM
VAPPSIRAVSGWIEAIYVTGEGGQPMRRMEEAKAVAGQGLDGDRYLLGSGYWTGRDYVCQVTLIEGEALDRITAERGVAVGEGQHRRNLVTRGVALADLAGHRFAIGDAVLEYDRPRPPCRYIATITEAGMTRALGGGRGGVCARVVTSGGVRVGDAIELRSRAP